jgi:hypothetical protein
MTYTVQGWLIEEEVPTVPAAGRCELVIIDAYEPLFYSATWTITALVDGQKIASSDPLDRAHTDREISDWVVSLINRWRNYLESLQVDVDAELEKWSVS